MLRNSAFVLSKLILKLSQVFKLFARYETVNLSYLVGFALTLTARCRKESRVESSFLTAQHQADFHPEI